MLTVLNKYYPIRKLIYYILEGCVILICLFAVHHLFEFFLGAEQGYKYNIWIRAILITFVVQISLNYNQLYEFKNIYTLREIFFKIVHALSISCIIIGTLYFLLPGLAIRSGIFFLLLFFLLFLFISWRLIYQYLCKKDYFKEKIFLIGSGELSSSILDLIYEDLDSGLTVSAICNPHSSNLGSEYGIEEIHDYNVMCKMILNQKIKKIVVALKEKRGNFPLQELLECRMQGVKILDGINLFETLSGKIVASQTPPSWIIFSEGFNRHKITVILKRIIDVLLSLIGIIIFSPLIIIISIAIKADSKGPVFFKQCRVGYMGKNFELVKFRTMVDKAEEGTGAVWAQSNDERITRVGRVLRKIRFDEIPQFLNILKGQMSFIGPRPERPEFVEQLQNRLPYYKERHFVKPGLSGWAQINYGYGASEDDALRKLEYDLFYIKHLSILLDLYIIAKTAKTVIVGTGR